MDHADRALAGAATPGRIGDFIVHHQISDGNVVMNERTDVLRRKDGAQLRLPVMGVFEIVDGRIAGWRDYFDQTTISAIVGAS